MNPCQSSSILSREDNEYRHRSVKLLRLNFFSNRSESISDGGNIKKFFDLSKKTEKK